MSNEKHFSVQRKSSGTMSAAAHAVQRKCAAAPLTDNRASDTTNVIQPKSKVQNQGATFAWGKNNKTIVGHHMKAWLDPADPLKGESASVNTDQTPMMNELRKTYVITGGDLVKGHLLNDNLGGKALNNNLFPITRAANKQHLVTTENYAKKELWENGHSLWYAVDVVGNPNSKTPQHAFVVSMGAWDMKKNKEGPAAISGSIVSNMGDPRDMDGANPDDLDKYSAMTLANAIKKGRAERPHSGPGTLNKQEKTVRDNAGATTNTAHDNTGYTHIS